MDTLNTSCIKTCIETHLPEQFGECEVSVLASYHLQTGNVVQNDNRDRFVQDFVSYTKSAARHRKNANVCLNGHRKKEKKSWCNMNQFPKGEI